MHACVCVCVCVKERVYMYISVCETRKKNASTHPFRLSPFSKALNSI